MATRYHQVVIILIFCSVSGAVDSAVTSVPAPASVAIADRLLSMEVIVNDTPGGVWPLLEHNGALHASSEAFHEWRLVLNANFQSVEFKGQQYWPLSAVPGYRSKFNLANQSVELTFLSEAFTETRIASNTLKRRPLSPVLPSLQFSYDLNYSQSHRQGTQSIINLSALTEVSVASNLGVLTSSAIGRNLTNNGGQMALSKPPRWLRLETTLTKDLPEINSTLRIGDSSTHAGMLGYSTYFGGIQFGTNFVLTPGFANQPLPVLTGHSAAPSTVQLYINDVLRQTSNVPAGPFALENLPTLTGSGSARIVVTDLLGRQTVIQQSFFTNSQLLRPGLDEWSVEAGKVRRNLGTAGGDYGPAFASGLWRHGFDNYLTLEGRGVVAAGRHAAEFGAVTGLPFQLLGRAALAASHDTKIGNGALGLLGLQTQGLRFGASLEVQASSVNYREFGRNQSQTSIKRQVVGNLSYASETLGTFGFVYAALRRYDSPPIVTFSTNYSLRVGEHADLSFTASRVQGRTNTTAVGMTLTFLLERDQIASAYVNRSGDKLDAYATYAQNPNPAAPVGWRVLAGQQLGQRHSEAGMSYIGRSGTLNGYVSRGADQSALQLGASGGMLFVDGHLFVTPHMTNSFALAEVKDYGDVGVGIGSNMLTRTDANGVALVPNLTAYQSNSIRLDPRDLPVDADLDTIEHDVVPAWRSGVKVVFPVRSGRGGLIKIRLDNGGPAPAGAIVKIDGDTQEFYVARRGEAFVTGLQKTANHLTLTWKKQRCKFDVILPPPQAEEIPRLGPYTCIGVRQ